MTYLILLILQLLGSLSIIAEILVPSLGLLSIVAASIYFYSYYYLYQNSPAMIPVLILLNLFTIPATLVYGVRLLSNSPLALRDSGTVDIKKPLCKIGDRGEAYTDLHPSGRGRFKGKMYDVLSTGDYISRGTDIEIISQSKRVIKVIQLPRKDV